MSLSTFAEMLPLAREGQYAVGAFNAWDLLSAKTLIETAERNRSPIILSLWQQELDFTGEEELWNVCLSFASRASVPVVIFIDHHRFSCTGPTLGQTP